MRKLTLCLSTVYLAALPVSSQAQEASSRLHTRAIAATCANCHGTDGRATEGSAIPSLVGMPKDYMLMQLAAFKDGSRPATVMHQLTKGFNDEQLNRIATYFSTIQR